MLYKSVATRGLPRKNEARGGGRFKSVTAASLLALACAASVGPANAEGLLDRRGVSIKDLPEREHFVYDWSGIYFGAHLGVASGDLDWGPQDDSIEDHEDAKVNHSSDGFAAGGHVGFNVQHGMWVFGLEASFSGTDLKNESAHIGFERDDDEEEEIEIGAVNLKSEMDGLFLATVRIGHAWDRWLGYVKGGYASSRVRLRGAATYTEVDDDEDFDFTTALASSKRHDGFTIGAGFEYALTDRVILGLEYNYIGLNAKTHSLVKVTEFDDGKVEDTERLGIRVDPDAIHTLWGRLTFKFNGDEAYTHPRWLP